MVFSEASRPPLSNRDDDTIQGHWLLARLGKRVLRPGGAKLTRSLLANVALTGSDVVELAPGLGHTAAEIIAAGPRSYLGIDRDPEAARVAQPIVEGVGEIRIADAAHTGLLDASADVVVGEAMLTMQGERTKNAIVSEAVRILRPGGSYAIHELALTPDDLPRTVKTDIRQAIARSIRVNARPLTVAEWQRLLVTHGLVVDHVETAPMALLQPRRIIADEGLIGALRVAGNLIRNPDARRRVRAMRDTFGSQRRHLLAVAVVAHKQQNGSWVRPSRRHPRRPSG